MKIIIKKVTRDVRKNSINVEVEKYEDVYRAKDSWLKVIDKDTIKLMRSVGGYESLRNKKYTYIGYVPTHLFSVSPDKLTEVNWYYIEEK